LGLTGPFAADSRDWLEGWPLHRDLQMLAAGRVCDAAQRRRCTAASGSFAPWACQVCEEYLRPEAVSPWTWHLVFLHQLHRAGYPFKANDLTLEEWLLLGLVQRIFTGERGRHAQQQPQ
jgi:hypothetical protein